VSTRPQVSIADGSLTVEPGRRVATRVRIRNTGQQVAHYRLSMVEACVPAPWTTITNPEVKLNPGADTDVIVQFEPPNDTSTRAGTFPYAVRVQPGAGDGQLPTVGEADLTVGAITAVEIALSPTRSVGRFNGKHRVLLVNRGTEDLQVRLRAYDDDEKLSAAVVPQTVNVAAGGTGEALLRVRPRTPTLVGKRQAHPFHVAYRRRAGRGHVGLGPTEGGEVEATIGGTYEQKPIVAKWMLVGLVLVVAAIGFLVSRALRGEPAAAPPPPRAPTGFLVEQQPGDMVQFQWRTEADVVGVALRSVACETQDDPFPQPDGDEILVDVAGSPLRRHPHGPLPVGQPLCFQARSVGAGDAVSIWTPVRTIVLGSQVVAPPTGLAVVPGASGTAEVSWDPVEDRADVRYDLLLDGASVDPNGLATTALTVRDLAPGEHEVRVQALFDDGTRSSISDAQTFIVPEPTAAPAEEGPGEAPADGADGAAGQPPDGAGGTVSPQGDATSTAPLPRGFFAVILPAGGTEPMHHRFLLSVARGVDPDDDGRFPAGQLRVVDQDIALPGLDDRLRPGATVFVQDGFVDAEEPSTRCQAYADFVQELWADGRAGLESGLTTVCLVYPPYPGQEVQAPLSAPSVTTSVDDP
jgi:hypothetical protein